MPKVHYTYGTLSAVPFQTHTIAAVGGFEADAVDLTAVVHRNPHGAPQTPVFGHYVRFPSPAFTSQNLPCKRDRAAAVIGAEQRDQFAAAIDLDAHFAEPKFPGVIHRCRSAALSAEAHRIVPAESSSARGPVKIVVTTGGRAVVTAAGAAVIAARDRPTQTEVILPFPARAVANANDCGEAVAARGFGHQADPLGAVHAVELEANDVVIRHWGVTFAAV